MPSEVGGGVGSYKALVCLSRLRFEWIPGRSHQ